MIAIIDYGASNLSSVAKAIISLGYQPRVTSDPKEIIDAELVILPGVGAAASALSRLQALGLFEPIHKVVSENRPFFGICLGLQVLFTFTEEGGGYPGFDLIPGKVVRLPAVVKVPHMGWNQVKKKGSHPIFDGIPDGANFYFVHSYYADIVEKSIIIGETDYGVTFCSLLAKGNLVATQFHPEKSGSLGLRMLHNFFEFAGVKRQDSLSGLPTGKFI